MTLTDYHKTWLTDKGINPEEASLVYGIHSENDSVVFPYPHSTKRRLVKEDAERRFTMEGAIDLFVPQGGVDPDSKTLFICEGETDAMRLAQEVDPTLVTGISGLNGWKPAFADVYKNAETVYVILDNDLAYDKTDTAWEKIRQDLGKKAVRVKLPDGTKDVCEFFSNFLPETFSEVLSEAKENKGQFHYKSIDLTSEPPRTEWLVEPYFARSHVCLAVGLPGSYKSWISMSLAVAIAEGWDEWLGLPINAYNRKVYYIDEENPLDVIYDRLTSLGLTASGAANIRYLSDAGIRLDKNAKYVLDEAIAWEPSLIVIDSLTRIHSSNENASGEMAKILNDGVRPLARATGAAVLLLHHENKSDSTNPYVKVRGSGDIPASVDGGISVKKFGDTGMFEFMQFRARGTKEHKGGIRCKIEDTPEGTTISRLDTGIQFH